MDREWLEESNRTTLVLETIYDNLRMRDANNTYKNTSLIKNKEGEQLYKVTTIVMTEKLSKQASDSTEIKGTVKIKNQKCEIKYKYGEENNTVQNIEDKSTIDGKIINDITIKDPKNDKENITMENLIDKMKTTKPKVKEVRILKEARQLRSSKRPRSPKKEEDNATTKKTSHHASKSRQDGLVGEMKPAFKATQTPKDGGMKEPSPGTSWAEEEVKEPSPGLSGDKKDKYKSTGRAMILSPDGKLIPFRMTDKIKKDDGG